ncbi:MAG: YggS family pyridoxal phosphate-dependent enzyme [Anaerolineales bacterium]|nr:YggS family pyridoxal phosphate-dependent enzyme [Anaerolineales bacterium]
MNEIAHNLDHVRERVAEAALRARRAPDEVTIVAVSKTFPADAVVAAYQAGARHFGENRVEEGSDKIPLVAAQLGDAHPVWHMIGHVQSRKAEDVVAMFDYVHSVDRLKIAERFSRCAPPERAPLPVLLECNVSGEASKSGFDLAGWQHNAAQLRAFLADVARILTLPGLRVEGLMTMAPLVEEPEQVRPVFSSLRALRDVLRERFPDPGFAGMGWPHLSMGMTDDFQVAVEEGATMVRIGRAIFGARTV